MVRAVAGERRDEALHADISRLRRALGGGLAGITADSGSLIRVADAEVDRQRFERLAQEGATTVSTAE